MSVQKRRILIICQHFWPENFRINDIADYFANEKDCEVDVLCGLPNYPGGRIYKGYSAFRNRKQIHKSIHIQRTLEIPRGNNSNIRIFLNYISFPFFSLFHLPRLLTKKYDQIFLYQLSPVMMSLPGILLGKLKRIPTTMYVLDLWPENLYSVIKINNGILRYIIQKTSNWHYRHVDKLIVLSEKMKARLLEVTEKNSDNITILPQTCEKLYEQEVNNTALTDRFKDYFAIVYAGNLSPAQSFGTIIDSAKMVIQSGVKDIRWVIVGDGMSRRDVENEVKKKGLSNYFIFEGNKPVEDIPAYTHIADAFIGALTKSDLLEATIPAKVISYIASGRPILLAMDGEVQELVNSVIKCGYASNTGDSKLLAQNTLKLYRESALKRDQMAKNAKSYYFSNLERSIILGRMFDFIVTPASKV